MLFYSQNEQNYAYSLHVYSRYFRHDMRYNNISRPVHDLLRPHNHHPKIWGLRHLNLPST